MTEEVSSKLSLLTRKLAEVGQLKGEIADKLFEEADAGIITKEQALEILDTYNLLPTDGYVSLPPYLDSYEYFERYSKVNYMDYTVPENFEEGQNLCCPLFPGITYEEAIDQLYGFVKKNRIIGPLRILRGIRFSITKRLLVSQDMWQVMKSYDYFNKML